MFGTYNLYAMCDGCGKGIYERRTKFTKIYISSCTSCTQFENNKYLKAAKCTYEIHNSTTILNQNVQP